MSIRKILPLLMISAELVALTACSNDPATAVAGPPNTVTPPSQSVLYYKGFIWSAEDGLRVIPTPSYAETIVPTGINDLGQVTGYVSLHDGQGDDRGFVWTANDGLQRIGSLAGPDGISRPLRIDDRGEVWGLSDGPLTRAGANGFAGELVLRDPFVWSASSGIRSATYPAAPKLNLPAGTDCTDEVSTSTAGFATGYAGSNAADEDFFYCAHMYAVMWEPDGTPVVLGDLCGHLCPIRPIDVNNRGEVLGTYADGEGFRWTRSAGFAVSPVETGHVAAINDNGDVAGAFETATATERRPFVWMASGEIRNIELPAGAKDGYILAIGNRGQVVGRFR